MAGLHGIIHSTQRLVVNGLDPLEANLCTFAGDLFNITAAYAVDREFMNIGIYRDISDFPDFS